MYRIIIITILFLFSFVRCTDLEVLPEDAFTEDEIFTSLENYTSYLAKAYGSFSLTGQDGPHGDRDISIVNDEGFTSYIRVYWNAQELTTDEAIVGWTDAGLRDLHNHSWSSENQFVRVLYYRIALIVSITNDFLKQSEEEVLDKNGIGEGDREIINGYRAEARFLRALAYWHALDLFRNIPLVTKISTALPEQATPSELFSFIESELIDVESTIALPRQNQYGRADQAAVWMLQAKLYLNAEHMIGTAYYDQCLEACEKVIAAGYSLEPNYQELFMINNHNSNELIFALNSDGKNTQNWGSTTFLVNGSIGGTMNAADYGVTSGWAGMRTTKEMLDRFPDIFGNTDKRAIFYTDGQSIEIDDIGQFSQGIAVPKYTNTDINGVAGSDPTHSDTDYPLFRLGDAYLMYAEATLRGAAGGSESQAVSYINGLRNRAYGSAEGQIGASDLNLDLVLDERVRELYWEGGRRLDLIRFGQFSDRGLWTWKGGVKEGRLTETHLNIFPIPASELLANPNIVQNPGY